MNGENCINKKISTKGTWVFLHKNCVYEEIAVIGINQNGNRLVKGVILDMYPGFIAIDLNANT